jgi:hypothetical protein
MSSLTLINLSRTNRVLQLDKQLEQAVLDLTQRGPLRSSLSVSLSLRHSLLSLFA